MSRSSATGSALRSSRRSHSRRKVSGLKLNQFSVCLLSALFLVGCTVTTNPNSGWWTFRGDQRHFSTSSGEPLSLPVDLAWEHSFPPTSNGNPRLAGIPVFGPDRVYVTSNSNLGAEEVSSGQLHAFDLATGEQMWTFQPDISEATATLGPPVIANGRIYATFEINGASGRSHIGLYALTPSGTVDWWIKLGGSNEDTDLAGAMNAIDGKLLFCLRHNHRLNLYALSQTDGEELFRVEIDQPEPENDGNLIRGWKQTPVLATGPNNHVLIATPYNIRSLDIEESGAEVWRYTFPQAAANSSAVSISYSPHHAHRVVVATAYGPYQEYVTVYALNGPNLVWVKQYPTIFSIYQTPIVAATQRQAFVLEGPALIALKPGDGEPIWRISDSPRHLQAPPAFFWDDITEELILAYVTKDQVRALRASDGEAVWTDELPGVRYNSRHYFLGGIAIDQGTMVACVRNLVRAYRSATESP